MQQTAADKRRFKAWVEQCPLRRWRSSNEVTIMQAAAQLNVSMTLIQLWERGVHVPSPENMAKLERVCGRNTARLWQAWYNEKPLI